MVDVARRRNGRGRGRAAERHQPLGAAAEQYAPLGWPVCLGAHPLPRRPRVGRAGTRVLL